jgi:hypothetical protein
MRRVLGTQLAAVEVQHPKATAAPFGCEPRVDDDAYGSRKNTPPTSRQVGLTA